jgi:serine-type D-Ala-D-Ala carboxypeptidase/endopeptidase
VTLPDQAAAAADRVADSFHAKAGQPGLAYGIVCGGRLAHARGLGEQWMGGPTPDAGTVFRIASMTKSFTAAAVLALRDDGALALDDPAARYVPELAAAPPAPGGRPVSLRHLLTMTAGLPTDDPWGDRQQGLPLTEFDALLRGGLSFAWRPGTRFEYSNTGYAILGRVITAASGQPYPDFVRDRLLVPLGLAGTGFHAEDVGAGRLARGYRHGDGGWDEVALDPCGAFAPMGGLFSCVADLARWAAGFVAAFGDGAGDEVPPAHPLAAASRREMQLPQSVIAPGALVPLPGDPLRDGAAGYGMGLFTTDHPAWGRIIGHSGGYPGFGSHMRWHPATGLGAVVLGNSTYAAATALASRLLDAVLRNAGPAGGRAGWPELAPGGPWPETVAAREAVTGLFQHWDDTAAGTLFAANVAQDEPYPRRRRKAELARERIGELRGHPGRPPEYDSPAHCRWWLRGERGVVQAEILLTPQVPPRVQALRLAVPPAPDSLLARVIGELVSLLNGGVPGWPAGLAASPWLDTGLAVRRLRMASAWAGRCVPGAFRAGDGETSATVELDGEHASLTLSVEVDPGSGTVHQADALLGP